MDVARQLDGLSPDEFDEWVAFRSIEPDPFDVLIDVLKIGFAALTNAQGLRTKPEDFDPRPKRDERPDPTPDQVAAMVRGMVPESS